MLRNIISILSLLIVLSQVCFAEDNHASLNAFPNAIISIHDPETGIIFYVESNGQKLVALNSQNGSVLWSRNIISLHSPEIGEPVIRHLHIINGQIEVVAGHHCFYNVDLRTGEAKFAGCD